MKSRSSRKWIWVREAKIGQHELIGDLDRIQIEMLSSVRTAKLNGIAVDLTALGSASILTVLVCAFLLFLFFQHKYIQMLHLFFAALGSALLTSVMKFFFERPRPDFLIRLVNVEGYSYPSGHSLSGAAVYFTLAILLCQESRSFIVRLVIWSFASLLILFISLSRLYLGVHYISDVMAGVLLGIAWAALLGGAVSFFEANDID